jgi:uncharacterized protein
MTISAALLFALAGCKGIGVNLNTTQPIKVDINVKLDVYQHPDAALQKKVAAASADMPADVQLRRKNRMGEVQLLKNSRMVGENHLGLLELRETPPAEFGEYAKRTVDGENSDRTSLMQEIAKKGNLTIADVQKQQADLAFKRAFNGEWVESAQPDGSYKWVQKGQ